MRQQKKCEFKQQTGDGSATEMCVSPTKTMGQLGHGCTSSVIVVPCWDCTNMTCLVIEQWNDGPATPKARETRVTSSESSNHHGEDPIVPQKLQRKPQKKTSWLIGFYTMGDFQLPKKRKRPK